MWRVKMLKRQSERWGPTPSALLRMVQARDLAAGGRVGRVLGLCSVEAYHLRATNGLRGTTSLELEVDEGCR